ncbi:MAG: DUF2752 domain-containing protein [Deltaproteobacteria bacterium]|nr:DUF2752 domain-containing protein [Deltaproteobacteria bacterium]
MYSLWNTSCPACGIFRSLARLLQDYNPPAPHGQGQRRG